MIKLTLTFKGKLLKIYQPKDDLIKIGRNQDCQIAIDNLALAPMHAVIEIKGNKATIIDKSSNAESGNTGVLVNGQKIEKQELNHKDEIQLGKYSLTFTREIDSEVPHAETPFPIKQRPKQGWLQFMNGSKLGRTIKLENPMVRLGKTGKASAMISHRDGKYYISHLEGEPRTRIANQDIPETPTCLKEGDILQVGETKILFFLQ